MPKKLLVLTEPRQDGKAFSDYQRGIFDNVLMHAEKICGRWDDISLVCTDSPASIIKKVSDAHVLLVGTEHAEVIQDYTTMNIRRLHGPSLYGILATHNKQRIIATPYMSDYGIGDEASSVRASLLGHLYRHLEILWTGLIGWPNPEEETKYRLVRNMEDWRVLKGLLKTKRIVCIDSETAKGLQRIGNSLLTLQFGFDGKTGWVLPIAHPESPLSGTELRTILAFLKEYFEYYPSAIHVYANAVFDLHQLIDLLKLRWYNHKIYDVQAAQFNLDESHEARKMIGYKRGEMWGLERLCLEAGMDHYNRTKLGKSDRTRLESKLLEDVAEYAGVDVVLPIRLMRIQRAIAKYRNERIANRPYERFDKNVIEVEGTKIQQFCFHPNTQVLTEQGPIPIQDLVQSTNSPRVWSFNHATGEKELQSITAVSTHVPPEEMLEIEYEGGSVRVTASHEFWCVNKGRYVRAKDLSLEDEFLI